MNRLRPSRRTAASCVTTVAVGVALTAGPSAAAPAPSATTATAPSVATAPASATLASDEDPFFTYSGSKPLASYTPGDVLKTRTISYHIAGISTPTKVIQVLYRTENAQGEPTANTTSLALPSRPAATTKVVSYQSAYDSLSVEDAPSRVIAGDQRFPGGVIFNAETAIIAPMLAKGYTVNIPDTEGPTSNFAAGPEYGKTTLDSIRAISKATSTGVNPSTKVGLIGYSGGAIGTTWASALAPSYAPDVNSRLVGAANGGVFVAPDNNLDYVSGTLVWSGAIPAALIGVTRAYDIDLDPYLNDYGKWVVRRLDDASLANALAQYPGISWKKMAKPEYETPYEIPALADAFDEVNLGLAPSPTTPVFLGQGANGILEGTPGWKPGIGAGDGVMITGDVRSLARQYCTSGTQVTYRQYDSLAHVTALAPWIPQSLSWLDDRFAGKAVPNSCGSIRPGNDIGPVDRG